MKNDIEAQPEWCGELAGQGIACRLLNDYMDVSKLSGYLLKPAAMLLSSFREILYLDADSNAIRNPDTHKNVPRERSDTLARLLEKHRVPMTGYITGARKYMVAPRASKMQTVESGQILGDKRRRWKLVTTHTHSCTLQVLQANKKPNWPKDPLPIHLLQLPRPLVLLQPDNSRRAWLGRQRHISNSSALSQCALALSPRTSPPSMGEPSKRASDRHGASRYTLAISVKDIFYCRSSLHPHQHETKSSHQTAGPGIPGGLALLHPSLLARQLGKMGRKEFHVRHLPGHPHLQPQPP